MTNEANHTEHTDNPKFTLFEGLEYRNRFFSMHTPDKDETRLADGTVAYKILGYANTVEEAQRKLYGHYEPLKDDILIVEALDALERTLHALKVRNLGKPHRNLDEVFAEAEHVLKKAGRE